MVQNLVDKLSLKRVLKYLKLNLKKNGNNYFTTHKNRRSGIYKRFNALTGANGHIGCSKSHIQILKEAATQNYEYVCILEDDVSFLNPQETKDKLNKIMKKNINWDVIILGGNNNKPYQKINEDCIKVNNCQTTTGYIVKQSYYDTLIDHWTNGLNNLIKTRNSPKYALDITWKDLQKRDNFLLIIPIDVIQRPDYSDIEKRNVNYKF